MADEVQEPEATDAMFDAAATMPEPWWKRDEAFAFANWVVGFVDGEGYFGIARCSRGEGRKVYYRCVLRITLAWEDADVLREIHDRTGWGTPVRRYPKAGPGRQDAANWSVQSKPHLAEVVEFFRAHPPRSKKALEFEVWSAAALAQVTRRQRGRGHSDPIQDFMVRSYERLRQIRRESRGVA